MPRVPLPSVGITLAGGCKIHPCEDVTPRSSLLRTHSPIPFGSSCLRLLASYKKSSQVATSPCCQRDLPDVISANPSSDAWSLAPAVPRSAYTCFFLRVIGLPHEMSGSASRNGPRIRLLAGGISTLQTFLDVQASEFARLPDRSYRCKCSAGQPRLLHPG
jgi:hypothetical protein